MTFDVLGSLILRGFGIGAAWGAAVAGIAIGFFGGLWCTLFENCTGGAAIAMLFYMGVIGAVIGAVGGLALGLGAGLLVAIELLVDEALLDRRLARSRLFPFAAAAQVIVGCAVFLPKIWFEQDLMNGGGGLGPFSGAWDAAFQAVIFNAAPALIAGYHTWKVLNRGAIDLTSPTKKILAKP